MDGSTWKNKGTLKRPTFLFRNALTIEDQFDSMRLKFSALSSKVEIKTYPRAVSGYFLNFESNF